MYNCRIFNTNPFTHVWYQFIYQVFVFSTFWPPLGDCPIWPPKYQSFENHFQTVIKDNCTFIRKKVYNILKVQPPHFLPWFWSSLPVFTVVLGFHNKKNFHHHVLLFCLRLENCSENILLQKIYRKCGHFCRTNFPP